MGSLSADFLTWSDSPVSDDSSIFRSFPWINTPSAGSRSPETREMANLIDEYVLLDFIVIYKLQLTFDLS